MRTILAGWLLLTLAAPGICGGIAYTDQAAFNAATAGMTNRATVTFDGLPDGSLATTFGQLSMSASGLASDGLTVISLPPIATATYPATSGANSLGTSWDRQFLSGNSDAITFWFTSPVNALGFCIIGNPSPTGTPAIPAWRLRVATPAPYDIYTAADPERSVGPGSDVYFLGIYSDEPFSSATLYSNNDPASACSFNIDDIVHAGGGTLNPVPMTIEMAKTTDIAYGLLSNVIVTRIHSDRFNVRAANGIGIAVIGTGASVNKQMTVTGRSTTRNAEERVIELDTIYEKINPTFPVPAPVAMNTLAVGGSAPFGLQEGISGSTGPNNVGLDAAICGKVTGIAGDKSWITVDDGGGRISGRGYPGVVVTGQINGSSRWVGERIIVRGSISCFKSGGIVYPLLRIASSVDLQGW